jgi:hypothetical protein
MGRGRQILQCDSSRHAGRYVNEALLVMMPRCVQRLMLEGTMCLYAPNHTHLYLPYLFTLLFSKHTNYRSSSIGKAQPSQPVSMSITNRMLSPSSGS